MDFRQHVRDRLPPLTIAREPEIVDELAEHLKDVYDDLRAAGVGEADAIARAVASLPEDAETLAKKIVSASRALPGVIADRWRASIAEPPPSTERRFSMLADLRRDIFYGIRMLASAPTFLAVVVVTLSLGVGANTLIFTAVDALLLSTPGVSDPDTVVGVFNGTPDGRDRFSSWSYPDFEDMKKSGAFRDAAAYGSINASYDDGQETQTVPGEIVSGSFFHVLGTPIALGRGFLPDDDRRGTSERAVVVSHGFWQERLGGKSDAIGRTMSLNGQSFTVVGVTPPLFQGAAVGRTAQFWVPMAWQQELRPPSAGLRRSLGGADLLTARGPRWLNVVGRLHGPGGEDQVRAALDVTAKQLAAAYPNTNATRIFHMAPLGEGPGLRTSTRPLLQLLTACVGLVLLLACTNVTGLLLARSVSRRREVAIRLAVGAGKGRLIRQWLTEAILLAVLGAYGGLMVARWGRPLLYATGIPESIPLQVSGRVLLFTFGIAAVSGVLFGIAPILQLLRGNAVEALRDEGGSISTGRRAMRLRRGLVVVQVAVSLVLLVGAGLFLRTLANAYAVDLGYRIDSTMVADVNLDVRGYADAAGHQIYRRILDRLAEAPGVASVGAARITVLSGGARTVPISVDGRPVAPDNSNAMAVRVNVISEGYLGTLGIPILRGRDFARSDDAAAPNVAIVSQSLATRLWPGQDPLGKALGDASADARSRLTVVGVVPDTVYRNALEQTPLPFYYLPLAQNYESGVGLHVRAERGDPLALLGAVRSAVRDVDPQLAVARPQRLSDVFEQSIGTQRMMATLVAFFGAIALILAAIGLYGVMAQQAGQRRSEIGLRLALGAEPVSIFALVLREGLALVLIGSAIGLVGAFAAAGYIETQLFRVRPIDPLTFVAVSALLLAAAVLACLIPARRAMRVDPVRALRGTV